MPRGEKTPSAPRDPAKICGAKRLSDYTPCQAWAMPNGRCFKHGGATPRGIAHHNYKHGRYSKDLPARLAGDYLASLGDPQLTHFTDQIAVHDTRYKELLRALDGSDLGAAWVDVKAAWDAYVVTRAQGDVVGMREALDNVERQITRGHATRSLWLDITEQSKHLKDLRQAEHKRLVDLDVMLTQQQCLLLFGLLLHTMQQAISTHVTDTEMARTLLLAIQEGVNRIELPGITRWGAPRIPRS